MSVARNFAYNAGYQLLVTALPFVTVPYISRVLGPEGVGAATYASSVAGYFSMAAALGMGTYGVRVISRVRDDMRARSRALWSLWAAQALTSVLALAAYALYLAAFGGGGGESADDAGGGMLAAVYACAIISCGLDATWFFFGCEEFRTVTVRNAAVRLVTVTATFALVQGPDDLLLYACISLVGGVVSQVALWPFLRSRVCWCRPTWRDVAEHLLPNLRLFVPVLAYGLYTSLGAVLLGAMDGYAATACFAYADKMVRTPQAVVGALSAVMLPHMTALLARGDRVEGERSLARALHVMMVASIGLACGLAAIAPSAVNLLLGTGYEETVPAVRIMVLMLPVISFSNVLGRQYLIPLSRDRAYTFSLVAGAIVELAVAFPLVEFAGVRGAAVSALVAEVAVLLVQLILVRGELPLLRWARDCVPCTAAGVAMFVAVQLLGVLLGDGAAALIVRVAAGAALYGAVVLTRAKGAKGTALLSRF